MSFSKQKPVLIFQHTPTEHPGLFGRTLEMQGIRSKLIHSYTDQILQLPSLGEIAGIISLGGSMGANEEAAHPWIKIECDMLRQGYEQQIPIVGVCLGAQLLARACGANVKQSPAVELGWLPIEITEAGVLDPIFGTLASILGEHLLVYQWHQDTFELPAGAALLAQATNCPKQAYRVGKSAYGLQFHPEVDAHLHREWLNEHGAEEEIQEIEKKYHLLESIQGARTQRHYSSQAETSNAIICAAVSTLFRREADRKFKKTLYTKTQWNTWASSSTELSISIHSELGIRELSGKVMRFFETALGNFVLFKSSDQRLWPIQAEDISLAQPRNRA